MLSSWQSHCESSPGSFDECKTAPSGHRPKTKPDDLGCIQAARIYIHRRHLLLLLSPKADTHVTIPQGVEGWVDLAAGYIPRWFTRPQTVTHPGNNRVWRNGTTLIEANALLLSQTANHITPVSLEFISGLVLTRRDVY